MGWPPPAHLQGLLLAEVRPLQAQGRAWERAQPAWLLHAGVGALRLRVQLLLGRPLHQRLCSWRKQQLRPASDETNSHGSLFSMWAS